MLISVTIIKMILAMATHQDKLRLAQAELDAVIGSEMPVMNDRNKLPYIHAIVKETLRWQHSVPLSVARSTTQDDYYRGYLIPKNTVILPNIWALANEPNASYPPDIFAPERFLGENPQMDPSIYSFGFGRRNCPGRELTENAVFIVTATLLSLFDIRPKVDEDGREIPINLEFSPGLISSTQDDPHVSDQNKYTYDISSHVFMLLRGPPPHQARSGKVQWFIARSGYGGVSKQTGLSRTPGVRRLMVAISHHLALAFAWINATNHMDFTQLRALSSEDFISKVGPASLGLTPTNKEDFLTRVAGAPIAYFNISLPTQDNIVESADAVYFYTTSNGQTTHGFPWKNEYLYTFTYTDDNLIKSVTEFTDPTLAITALGNEAIVAKAKNITC
ncbi:hypothetical protein DXG01_016797 [Tephrocybe rancida]|nr:hypothetical protein DXG01_016797 [Tephrocybe rancida]